MPPTVVYQIGSHQFLFGRGEVPQAMNRIERLVYPGANGSRWRKAGAGHEPFRVTTVTSVADEAAGVTLEIAYAALVGAAPQTPFTWAGVNYTTSYGRTVLVVGFEILQLSAVVQWCNSFDDTNHHAKLECAWELELR